MNHRLLFAAVVLVSCAFFGCGDKTTAKPDSSAKASSAPASAKPAATTTATAKSTGSSDSGW